MANGGRIDYTVGFKVDSSNLQSIRNQLSDLAKISNVDFFNKNSSKFGTLEKASEEMKNIRHLIHEVEDAYDGAFDSTTGVTNVNKLASSLKNIGVDKIENSFKQLGVEGTKAWNQITSQVTQTNLKFKETNNFLTKIGETLTNTIKWGIASSALNKFTGSIQQAWGYVQHLDTSLNDIRIVTGKSADEMDRFAEKANNAAKSLGQSTTAYTEAALIYYQQGLSDEESQARAETTLKAANVTGQTGREVSEQLTAVWNGYKVSAEETELYVDKLAAVAATTASDLEELSTGMSKVASAANNMGVDIDQLNAQLATIVSVTRQAPETAGTALKTIYARMEDLKIGGEDESGVKLGDVSSTLEAVGISVMDTQGDLRDLGEVIEEVAAKWDTWTSAQQNAIAQALAGKRQYNNLLALFDNWDMYTSALETSRNSVGTLQKQQDIYMESTAAHLQQLKTEWEDLYDSLIDTNDINEVLDLFTSGLDKITDFVDAIGGGKSVLAGMIALLGQIPGISSSISNQLGSVIEKFLNAKYNAVEWANTQQRVLGLLSDSTHAKVFKEISDYENILTDKNKEEIAQLANQVDLLEKKKNAQQDALDLTTKEIQLRAKGLDAANSIGEEQYSKIQSKKVGTSFSGKDQENFNFVLDEQIDKLDEAKQAFKEYMQAAEETASIQEKFNKAVEEGDAEKQNKYFDQLIDSVDELAEKRKNFEKPLQVFKDTNNKDIKNILNTADKLEKEFNTLEADSQTLGRSLDQVGREGKEGFENIGQGIKVAKQNFNTLVPAVAETSEALNNARKALQDYIEGIAINNFAEGITKTVSGLSSLAFSIQAIQNLGSIWKNEDTSTGDKILSTITAIGTTLPMLAMGFNNLRVGLSKISIIFQSASVILEKYVSETNKVSIAKAILNGLTEEEKRKVLELAAAEATEAVARKINTGEIDEETAAIILNTLAKEGNISASKILLGILRGKLTGAVKGIATGFSKMASAIGVSTGALAAFVAAAAAAVIAAVVIDKHLNESAKKRAEASQREVEATQKAEEAAKEHLESVKQLISEYKKLKEQYSEDNIEELRQKVYDLCIQYGIQIDTLKLMKASYEELETLMNDIYNEALKDANAKSLENINAQTQYLIDNAKSIEEDAIGPLQHLYLWYEKLASLVNPIGRLGLVTEKLVNIQRKSENPEVYSILSENGQIDWDKFYNASIETQDAIEAELEKRNKGLLGRLRGVVDPTIKANLKAVRENRQARDQQQQELEEYKTSRVEEIYSTSYQNANIQNASDYNKIKNQFANQLVTDLQITEEEAVKLAEEKLSAREDGFTIKSSIAIGEELSSSFNQSAEEIANQYAQQSTAVKEFISNNLDMAEAYDNLDSFINDFDDIIDRENDKNHLLNVEVALNNADGEEFKPEDIEAMFAEKGFEESLGKSKEDFEKQTYEQQLADLSVYYIKANQLENEFQQNKRKGIEEDIEARKKTIEDQQSELTDIVNNILTKYKDVEQSDLFQGKIDLIDSQLENVAKKADESLQLPEDTFSMLDEYVEALQQGGDATNNLSEETLYFIDALKYQYKLNDEDLTLMRDKKKAYMEYQEAIENSSSGLKDAIKDSKSYAKALDKLDKEYQGLTRTSEKLSEQSFDWEGMKKSTDILKKSTNSTIDSLQGAYSSLTSIMEEYNETQTLSMDNLQTLLNMDTAYLSALKIENGQMSLNEDSLKQIALAKLDEAEAEAYAQAMEELHNETTKQGMADTANAKIALADYGAAATNAAQAARAGAADWKAYWDAALNREGVANDAYAQKVGAALQTKLQAIGKVREQIMSGNGFSTTMKGPEKASSSSGASSTEKEADHEDYLERETDLYRAINEELDDIESTLGRIQEFDDHSWGLTAKKALEQENKLLKQQLDMLEKKKDTYERDLGARRGALESQGINFSEDGSVMTNAEDKINQLYGEYNAMVDKYNAMSADDQESFKETLEAKKDSIDEIEDAIDKYEDGYNDYNSVLDELLDTHYELIENEVNHFNADIDVHLELDEAEQEWNDFWYEVVKDIEDEDFAGRIRSERAHV